jgi:hypothetical protein
MVGKPSLGPADTESEGAVQEDRRPTTEGKVYQIRVSGHLDCNWSEWLDGLSVAHEQDGTTVLTGAVTDQPALHGLLNKIRDLGLHLRSVEQMGKGEKRWTA